MYKLIKKYSKYCFNQFSKTILDYLKSDVTVVLDKLSIVPGKRLNEKMACALNCNIKQI